MVYGRFMACAIVILTTGINPTNINPITYTSYEKTLWIQAFYLINSKKRKLDISYHSALLLQL